jgi:hypothetical protein
MKINPLFVFLFLVPFLASGDEVPKPCDDLNKTVLDIDKVSERISINAKNNNTKTKMCIVLRLF